MSGVVHTILVRWKVRRLAASIPTTEPILYFRIINCGLLRRRFKSRLSDYAMPCWDFGRLCFEGCRPRGPKHDTALRA